MLYGPNWLMLGKQTVTGIFRERIAAAPGSTIRMSPDLSLVHLFGQDGVRMN